MRMRTHLWIGVLLAVALVAATMAGCAAPARSPAAAPSGAPQEGIKVHGHWTIEVTNPDGTLAERREFENDLTDSGREVLQKLLARQNSAGGWYIQLYSSDFFNNAWGNPALIGYSPGYITESTFPGNNPYYFKNLTVTLGQSQTLVLSGTATASISGIIEHVMTKLSVLSATSPPSATYPTDQGSIFTHTILTDAINLGQGQQVAVTVVISFS